METKRKIRKIKVTKIPRQVFWFNALVYDKNKKLIKKIRRSVWGKFDYRIRHLNWNVISKVYLKFDYGKHLSNSGKKESFVNEGDYFTEESFTLAYDAFTEELKDYMPTTYTMAK